MQSNYYSMFYARGAETPSVQNLQRLRNKCKILLICTTSIKNKCSFKRVLVVCNNYNHPLLLIIFICLSKITQKNTLFLSVLHNVKFSDTYIFTRASQQHIVLQPRPTTNTIRTYSWGIMGRIEYCRSATF